MDGIWPDRTTYFEAVSTFITRLSDNRTQCWVVLFTISDFHTFPDYGDNKKKIEKIEKKSSKDSWFSLERYLYLLHIYINRFFINIYTMGQNSDLPKKGLFTHKYFRKKISKMFLCNRYYNTKNLKPTWLQMERFTSITMENYRFFTCWSFHFCCTRVHSNKYTNIEVSTKR